MTGGVIKGLIKSQHENVLTHLTKIHNSKQSRKLTLFFIISVASIRSNMEFSFFFQEGEKKKKKKSLILLSITAGNDKTFRQ